MKTPSRILRIVVTTILALIAIPFARATTDTWTGGGGNASLFWLNTANWNPAAIPQTGDSLVFTNTVGLVNSNNIPGGNFAGITFATPSGAFSLNGLSVTLGSIADLQVVTPETINLPITDNSSGNLNLNVTANGILNLNNVISGTGALTNSGAGTVNLHGSNTFAGPIVINAGVVQASQETNLSAASTTPTPNNIVINGGTLQALTSFTINTNHGIAIGPSSGSGQGTISVNDQALTPNQFTALRYGGLIANNGAGSGSLTKIGFGNLILAGANTYTGTTSNQVGTLTLDFAASAGAPQNNIISSSSPLVLGGSSAGAGVTNFSVLIISNKASTINSQTFNGTHITIGDSTIRAVPASSGTLNIALGALDHDAGGTLILLPPTTLGGAGNITTTTSNTNGILGGWATIGSGSINVGWNRATNWAAVDNSGNIVNYTGYSNYTSAAALMKDFMVGSNNIYVSAAVTANFSMDVAHVAGQTNDVNSIVFESLPASIGFLIGSNNTVRLGQFGGLMKKDTTAGNNWHFGDSGTVGDQTNNISYLTAGGPNNNTAGEIVFINTSTSSGSGNNWDIDPVIEDNGSGAVTVVLSGSGYNKFRNHNTYSGGTYLMGGRLQLAGGDIGTANPDGLGTGPIYVFPGSYLFGTLPTTPVINIAGIGTVQEPDGAWRLSSGNIVTNSIVLFGDSGIGGGNLTTPAIIMGPISGNFNMYFGALGNVGGTGSGIMLSNQCLWTGDTTIVARTASGNSMRLFLGENDALPHGFGKGDLRFGVPTVNSGNRIGFDLNGFNQTINGLFSGAPAVPCIVFNGSNGITSTLTIGDNDASGAWGGIVEDTDATFAPASTGKMAITKIGGGVQVFTNISTYTGVTTISNGVLQLTGVGSINNSPLVNISGGTFDVSGLSYGIPAGQTINASGGTFFISSASSSGGPVNFTNGTLKVTALNVGSANLSASTVNLGGAANIIQPSSIPQIPAYPAIFPIIHYSSVLNGDAGTLGLSLPAGYGGFVTNVTTAHDLFASGNTIYLELTNGPVTPLLTWLGFTGAGVLNSTWDFVVSDWTNKPAHAVSSYTDGSLVIFDDSGATNVVNISGDVLPAGVTVANTNLNYTFAGIGGIRGTNGLTKAGSGKLVLDNSGTNDFSGGMSLSGTVQVGLNDANGGLGTGAIGDNGTLVFDRNNSVLSIPNTITGSGGLIISNASGTSLTLGGANSFAGPVTVVSNITVIPANSTAFGTTAGGTTMPNGSTLDVNGGGLGVNGLTLAEPITISGAGVDGTSGAIVNSSATIGQQNALQQVTLSGNTTFGGASRWDIRGTPASPGSLNTGGQPFNIIKKGANFISLANLVVDPALGSIDVQNGTLELNGTLTGLGNSQSNLTLETGTTLQLFALTNQLNKNIVVNNAVIDSASGNNTIIGPVVDNGSLTVNQANNTSLTINNALTGITGTGTLTKNSTNSTLTIAGVDNHSGGTTINDGTLIYNAVNTSGGVGNQLTENSSPSGAVIVGGSGTYGAPVDIEDTLHPGAAGHPSTLSVGDNNDYNFDSGGALVFGYSGGTASAVFDLNSATTVGGGVNDLVNVTGNFAGDNANVFINPLTPLASGSVYTLINFTGANDANFNQAHVVPSLQGSRYVFTLSYPANKVQLTVNVGTGSLKWNNAANTGIWDVTNSFNWFNTAGATNDYFAQLDSVLFDDSIGNAGSAQTNTININTTVKPGGPVVVNSATNYAFVGSGKISGTTSLVKKGSGVLSLNTANDFTGSISVYGGTLQVNAANASISSTLITNGTLTLNNVNGLGTTNTPIYVTNSGTLDIGGTNFAANQIILGNTPLNISGWGVNSNGALINSSATTQENSAQNVILTGDAAIGGPGVINGAGRFDIGRTTPASLSSGGHPYTLYKVGSNQVSLVSVTMDTNLGNIDIKGGELGFEQGTTTMGNPLSNLTVEAGAKLEFFSSSGTNNFTKQFVLNGDGVSTNIYVQSGTVTLNGNMTLNNAVDIGVAGTALTNNALISGSGSLTKTFSGALVLTAGETYTGNTIVNGGTLTLLGNGAINNSTNIILQGATIDVTSRTNGTLTLVSGQTLSGSGTIAGSLTNLVGSIFLTGTNGSLTVTTNATFGGAALIANQLDHGSNTLFAANGILTYAGTLTVTTNAASTTTLTSGTVYKLFNASTYMGSFSTFNLPALAAGLTWNTGNLANNGTISIASTGPAPQPHITGIALSGTTLSLSATNGTPGGTWTLLQSTNVALPLAQWGTNQIGTFDGSGNLSTNIVNTVTNGQEFYILKQ